MNTHTIQAERAVYAGTALSERKELEIEREILLQQNKTADLEVVVVNLLNRLSPVMRGPETVAVDAGLPVEDVPATELGGQLRNTSLRIGSLTERVQVALQRLELS